MDNQNKFVIEYPDLMNEWDWEQNNSINIYPDKITYGSIKKAWWKCNKCGYKWQTTPNARTSGKTGCPCCAGRTVVRGINDLQTLFPEVAKKWHPTKNLINAYEVTPFSNKKAWWICEQDNRHEFEATIYHVTKGNSICPVCCNQTIIIGVNDFQTTNPELMKEWNWNKNNNAGIYPTKITKGINKKVWWQCSICNHEWQATVGSRAGSQKCGCPQCKKDLSTSFPEKAISFYLSKYFTVEENKKFSWLSNSEIDIYIDELKMGIEYDGKVWHQNINKDYKKDILCEKNNILLIRIREKDCPTYESTSIKVIRDGYNINDLNECVKNVFNIISHKNDKNFDYNVDIENDYMDILERISNMKKINSVASTELIKSWNYSKNGKISPENISLGTHKKFWWVCENGHEWQSSVYSRSSQKCGCPYCAGQKVLSGENDLQTLYPHIAKEWDYNKNEINPDKIRPQTNKIYWWICSECGFNYQSSPSHRVGRGDGCHKCGRTKTIASHFKKVINLDTNEVFSSVKEASDKYGISASGISNCCRGISITSGGYRWKYLKQ